MMIATEIRTLTHVHTINMTFDLYSQSRRTICKVLFIVIIR